MNWEDCEKYATKKIKTQRWDQNTRGNHDLETPPSYLTYSQVITRTHE